MGIYTKKYTEEAAVEEKKGGIYKKRYTTPTKKEEPVKKKTDIKTLEGLAELAREKGFEKEAEIATTRPKLSMLQRLGRGLSSFETGNALYAKRYEDASFFKEFGKDIKKGLTSAFTGKDVRLTPKKTYKDILLKEGMKDRPGKIDTVDVLGLAADIVADPTTFFGGFIGKGVKGGISGATKASKKVPAIKTAIEGFEDLFVHDAKFKRMLGEDEAKKFGGIMNNYYKSTRAYMEDFVGEISKKAKTIKKDVGTKEFKALRGVTGEMVESGVKSGNKLLQEAVDSMVEGQKGLAKSLKERGIINATMEDYMHHMLTPDAAAQMRTGADMSAFLKPLRAKLTAGKTRKIEGTIKEINEEWQKKFGHDLFEGDAFKSFAKVGADSIKAIRTHDVLKRIGSQFGKTADDVAKDTSGMKWAESTAPQLKGTFLPKPIAKEMDETFKFLTNDEASNAFIKLYDKAQNFWKGSVTGYFPAFHTRNAIGGMFNNFIAGVHNPAVYKTATDVLRKGKSGNITTKAGKKISYESIRKMLKDYGVIGQSGYLDTSDFLKKEVDPSLLDNIKKAPQKVMGVTENYLRAPLFIDGLKKGMSPEDAAKNVIKYHFDYMPEGFTAFEKNIMKRVIPFYTWTRNNIPLQLEQMLMKPGKYSGVFKTQRAFGTKPSSEEEAILPPWLKERFVAKGEGGYWSGAGLPLEEVTDKLSNPLRGLGLSLSPFIKTPFERMTGFNIYQDRPISEDIYAKYYRHAPEPIKKYLQLKERTGKNGKTYYVANPERKYWLELIGARGLNTGIRAYDYLEEGSFKKALQSIMTTIKKYGYDKEDLKRWSEKESMRELEDLLKEANIIQEGKYQYVPKEEKTTR